MIYQAVVMCEYISLGNTCGVAYQLQQLGLRQNAYPFDWLLSQNINGVIDLITSDFSDILNPKNIVYKSLTNNFPLLDDDWKEEKDKTLRVVDTKYKLTFMHDFQDKSDLENVIIKYKRRCDRFMSVMSNPDVIKKIFRVSHQDECAQLELLEKYFIQHNYSNFKIYFKKYDEMGPTSDWKFDNFNWKEWFIS